MTQVTRLDPCTRIHFDAPVTLLLPQSGSRLHLRAANLCQGGIYVLTVDPLPLHTEVQVRFTLPGGHAVSSRARVIRSAGTDQQVEPAGMALQFEDLPPAAAHDITGLIEGLLRLQHGGSFHAQLSLPIFNEEDDPVCTEEYIAAAKQGGPLGRETD